MITFKEFLQEDAVATKRRGVQHLQKMKPADFILLMREIKKQFPSGKLTNVAMNLKIDGMGFRFGRDSKGRPFFESSYSGPVYDAGQFVDYAKKQGDPGQIGRAEKTEEIFQKVMNGDVMKVVPKDRKVMCEILYNPLGEITSSGAIKFVHVAYDRAKLGQTMTIVPYNVVISSTGEVAPDADQIKQSLNEVSTPDIKVLGNRLQHDPIDISATVDAVKTLTPNALEVLRSRKKVDAEAKQVLTQTIQKMKERLADIILTHKGIRGKDVLGDQIEGLVLTFGDHEVKVTPPEIKQAVAASRAERGKRTAP